MPSHECDEDGGATAIFGIINGCCSGSRARSDLPEWRFVNERNRKSRRRPLAGRAWRAGHGHRGHGIQLRPDRRDFSYARTADHDLHSIDAPGGLEASSPGANGTEGQEPLEPLETRGASVHAAMALQRPKKRTFKRGDSKTNPLGCGLRRPPGWSRQPRGGLAYKGHDEFRENAKTSALAEAEWAEKARPVQVRLLATLMGRDGARGTSGTGGQGQAQKSPFKPQLVQGIYVIVAAVADICYEAGTKLAWNSYEASELKV
ncbi:Alpha-amylase [Frankliniella fusca]|uniref:Alpha-amylase n=1 Tax=Frankliniella fusca TaxID=407009 RepID=A0AAE1HU81_9NEOP|nr:Alpha-amylase [Frankliniella fusca]